jgi:hypothetical protein
MLSGIGGTTPYDSGSTNGKTAKPRNTDSLAALSGEIRDDQIQLNDWTTCVSAKTSKGQAEIQKLTARVSAAKEHVAQIEAQNAQSQPPAAQASTSHEQERSGGLVDTWA